MKIQIDGVNTMNKGAELMLVSILEEIERTHPYATVYINPNNILDEKSLPKTANTLKIRKALKYSRYGIAIMKKLNLPFTYFTHFYPIKGIDIVLDASGFQYSDQWIYSDTNLKERRNYYLKLKKFKTQLVFLPQAFGPFNTQYGKNSIKPINDYVDIIIARDKISYDYLEILGFLKKKLWRYPDFTFITNGSTSKIFEHLKDKVCIIPNKKIISHSRIDNSNYIKFLVKSIELFKENGKDCFLLNHENDGDYEICILINNSINSPMEILSGLDAKQVKGIIGQSFVVFSSRFHGVASSLSTGVPCLATSWNHKYKMLYADFEIEGQVLDLEENWDINKIKIQQVLDNREQIREHLLKMKRKLMSSNRKMWKEVWNFSAT